MTNPDMNGHHDSHAPTIRPLPGLAIGWIAECSCGWHGPERRSGAADAHARMRAQAQADGIEHVTGNPPKRRPKGPSRYKRGGWPSGA